MLLLALGLPLALVLAIQGMNQAAAAMAGLPLAASLLFPAAAGSVVHTGVERRLRHLREESVVARHALRRGPAWCHGIFWNLVPLGLAVALALLSDPNDFVRAALFGLGYLLGTVVAHAQALVSTRFRQWLEGRGRNRTECSAQLSGATQAKRVAQLLTSRIGLAGGSLRRNLLLLAILGVVIGAAYRVLGEQMSGPAPAFLAAAATLLLLAFLLRLHPPLLRYLLYLGFKPETRPVLIPVALAAALLSGLLAVLAVGDPQGWALLGAAALVLLAFAVLAALRALHFATRTRQAAEFALQIDFVAAFLIGMLAFPLLLPAVAARLWLLVPKARAMQHLLA
jgi:hypothetical protein